MAIGRVLELSSFEASALADTLDGFAAGIFIVDRRGAVAHANIQWRAHAAIRKAPASRHGMLIAIDADANAALVPPSRVRLGRCGHWHKRTRDHAVGPQHGNACRLCAAAHRRTRKRAGVTYAPSLPCSSARSRLSFRHRCKRSPSSMGSRRELSVFLAIVEVGGVPTSPRCWACRMPP